MATTAGPGATPQEAVGTATAGTAGPARAPRGNPRRPGSRSPRHSAGLVLCAALASVITGCSSAVNTGGAIASSALSAAASAASSVAASAGSAAAGAVQSAIASASAAASSQLAAVKNGVDAKADVSLGTPSTDSSGRVSVELTVTNHGSGTADYTIAVDYRDPAGNLLDTAVVNVDAVGPGQSKTATARSNRTLAGQVSVAITAALRH